MDHSESVHVFLRFLNQRYTELKSQLENMLKTMSSSDEEAKLTASREFLSTSSGLALTLAASDRPAWLKDLIDNTEWYVANHGSEGANHTHVMHIIDRYEQAMHHEWQFDPTDEGTSYSYDELYEDYRNESKIEALSEGMVDALNQMIDSCEIDSVSAINSLDQLVLLIDQNKSGPYSSISATREFIAKFLRNTTWMQIRKIPGVKNFKDIFEKTAKELDIELDRLHRDIVAEIQQRYDSAVKPVPQRSVVRNTLLETTDEA